MRSNEEIINLIKQGIKVNQFSYAEFARRVHLSTSALSRYITCERPFPIEKAEIFARELGVSVEWLLDGQEEFLSIFNQLNDQNKRFLLDYAKFLHSKQDKY